VNGWKVIICMLVLLALSFSGCVERAEVTEPKPLYVCPSGEIVQDPSLCLMTEAPPTPAPETPAPTTPAPTTTAPPATTTTTLPSTMPPTTPPATTPPPTQPPQRPELEVVEQSLELGPGGEFWLSGRIRNNGERERFHVQARLTLYDDQGRVLKVLNSAPISKLSPGESMEFNTIKTNILAANVARYNVSVISD